MKHLIIPSIMAKNQRELDDFFDRLCGVSPVLHLDIADGKCVPTRVLDFPFRLSRSFRYHAHLMVKQPERWIQKSKYRIDLYISPIEEIRDPQKYIQWMKKRKQKVAFSLRPETPATVLYPYLSQIDYVLILTVHPGFYGGRYLKTPLRKIPLLKHHNPHITVIVDGGINPQTIRQAATAGADWFITGSYTTKAKDPKKAIKTLQQALR